MHQGQTRVWTHKHCTSTSLFKHTQTNYISTGTRITAILIECVHQPMMTVNRLIGTKCVGCQLKRCTTQTEKPLYRFPLLLQWLPKVALSQTYGCRARHSSSIPTTKGLQLTFGCLSAKTHHMPSQRYHLILVNVHMHMYVCVCVGRLSPTRQGFIFHKYLGTHYFFQLIAPCKQSRMSLKQPKPSNLPFHCFYITLLKPVLYTMYASYCTILTCSSVPNTFHQTEAQASSSFTTFLTWLQLKSGGRSLDTLPCSSLLWLFLYTVYRSQLEVSARMQCRNTLLGHFLACHECT